jgi:hypothetical protein
MDEPYIIKSVQDIIKIGVSLSKSWFRGHSETFNNLTPGIFREKYSMQFSFKPDFELRIYEEFKRVAPSISNLDFSSNGDLEWLFVMQHYGLPTRLLDWSESILVAAFFAVEKNQESDAELWAMYPDMINQIYGFEGMPIIKYNKDLQFLASEHRHTNPKQLSEELGLKKTPNTPMALRPPIKFERMVLQQSVFTIHPRPKKNKSIINILKSKEHLIRYIIPKNYKNKILSDLYSIGINKRTLFGDLTSLSESILEQEKTIAYTPPDPPKLLGPQKIPKFF